MISTGVQLKTFTTNLNGGATIDETLLGVLISSAKAILEEERPWMVLRKTDSSKAITTGNTWQTAIDLSTISDFSRLHINDDSPTIRLFDGANRIERYILKPFEDRLEWKDVSNTCVYDENSKTLYLNGTMPFSGSLYIPYISTSTEIDLTSDDAVWTVFPSRFLPILGFYAVGIHMGGVDYDTITARQAPNNLGVMQTLKNAMEEWDNQKQLATIQSNDPSEYPGGYPRTGAINRYDD